MEKICLSEIFGKNVFDDKVMKERLPKNTYKQLRETIDEGKPLDPAVAEVVANAMKDWAIEHGATHFTHWFQPMNGRTAEKHDSFLFPTADGRVVMEFSGKELIKGEADGSSFPSGGLRQTFEARGYTVWDCTSPAFLKEDISGVALCIPTAFYSHSGEALDKKAPLLRSMEALEKASLRVLHALGDTGVKKVTTTIGAEQEYFLVDKRQYQQRKDLIFTGRTLFGAMPPKGQEMEDHYFGSIKEKIGNFMREIDIELWKLGVPSKTKHNEVAPAQHELAPIFATANVAADQNQLVMETLQKIANRHELACLLHEKPFRGVNGSGKHNNWSLITDTGKNLLSPGKHPKDNLGFLVFLAAIIKAVDEYAELIRLSAATAGNDHRLGANEAPPAIISIFLGEPLTDLLVHVAKGEESEDFVKEFMEMGVATLPKLKKEMTDRNRTSPFAFTGNKFEFRMFQSSGCVSDANVVLNTAVAKVLHECAVRLEKTDNIQKCIKHIVRDILNGHGRIIFNGNGYGEEWLEEATRRGLPNYRTTVEAIPSIISEKAVELFSSMKVLNDSELKARYEILIEEYYKTINVEAKTMLSMARGEILPAIITYTTNLATNIHMLNTVGCFTTGAQRELLEEITSLLEIFKKDIDCLDQTLTKVNAIEEGLDKAVAFKEQVLPAMEELRKRADALEILVDEKVWPIPTYAELLFRV
jgi:glutamine synthetase